MNLAPAIDAIPTVASTGARNAKYPSPAVDQRVFNKGTGCIERWTGAAWVQDFQSVQNGLAVASVLNPLYGAQGDGVTDDGPAFNAAISAVAGMGGGVVYFPPTTAFYSIATPIVLQPGVRILGGAVGAADLSRLRVTGDIAAFSFCGTVETQSLSATIERVEIDSATSGVGIGVRLRNFDDFKCIDCTFLHLAVGFWADWCNEVRLVRPRVILNTRGLQFGGNLSQTTTPVPAAGIRGGSFAPNFCDDVSVIDPSFSQNQIDVNHMGSQYSVGGFTLRGGKFFESSTSPVAGKNTYVRLAGLKSALVERNEFECPQAARICVDLENTDYDGNVQGPSYGVAVRANSFLTTNAVASCIGVNVGRGHAVIDDNAFESGAGSTPIQLGDGTTASHVGLGNKFLTFHSGSQPTEGFANPVNVTAAPAGGHTGLANPAFLNLLAALKVLVGTSTSTAKVPAVLFQDGNQLTVSTSDTSIGNSPYAMPGGSLGATAQQLRITARGRALTQAASVNVKFGATVLATIAVAAGEAWSFTATIVRTSSASQLANITTVHGSTVAESAVAPGETMANAINIDFRGSVTSGGTLRLDQAQVEVLAA